jgi:hypothetical protein
MARRLQAQGNQVDATLQFIDRALTDFGLLEAFEHRPPGERAECLRWISASVDSRERDDRVSWLLDALAAGTALVPAPGAERERRRQTAAGASLH